MVVHILGDGALLTTPQSGARLPCITLRPAVGRVGVCVAADHLAIRLRIGLDDVCERSMQVSALVSSTAGAPKLVHDGGNTAHVVKVLDVQGTRRGDADDIGRGR